MDLRTMQSELSPCSPGEVAALIEAARAVVAARGL